MEDPLNFREMFNEQDPPEQPVEKTSRKGLYTLTAAAILLAGILFSVRPVLAYILDQREQHSIASLKSINNRIVKQVVENHALSIDLSDAEITPRILADLENLQILRVLDLSGSRIQDVDLSHLKGMTHLEALNLNDTGITDAGLAQLAGLSSLDQLLLKKTQISDVGLEYLKGLCKMMILDLSETQITDEGLTSLRGLSNLNYLFLNGTKVTDRGLDTLLDLENLLRLELIETKVTVEGNRLFMFKTLKCQTQYNPYKRYDDRKRQ